MRRTFVLIAAGLVIALGFGIVLTRRLIGTWHPEVATSAPAALTPGDGLTLQFSDHPVPMPTIDLTDVDGRPVDRTRWTGKVLLVNFWATWCGPCREEIPALVALQEHYKDQVVVLGLSIDTRPPAEVKQFALEHQINYPIAVVGEDVIRAFGGVPAVPSTFVVGPGRGIVQRHVGLINPIRTEHEIRTLAGLATPAKVESVKDTGQVLLANAAYATEIPGVDLAALTPAQKERALARMNEEDCTCGCGLKVAQCRVNDPSCAVSLPQATKIVQEIMR